MSKLNPVLGIALVVVVVLLGALIWKLTPAPYTLSVEGSGGTYLISLADSDGSQVSEAKLFKGTVPDKQTYWTSRPFVTVTFGSESEATLTIKRWGKVCATSRSPGKFAKGDTIDCYSAQSLH